MWMAASPVRLARIHIETLLELLPRVVDGDVDGVHDARVLTRRVRELLPLTREWHSQKAADALTARFRRIGRALGRVRDADVRLAMLRHLEGHIPDAAPSLVVVRQASERDRLGRIREPIKRFERLEVGHARYLTRRPRLVEICDHARRELDRGPVAAAAPKLAASALARTSAVYAWQRLRAEGSHPNSREVSLRIPIDVPSTSTR